MHENKKHLEIDDEIAQQIGDKIGVKWDMFGVDQFRRGMAVEFEHGLHDKQTNVTGNDLEMTGKIAWAHLKEFPDYYTRLEVMEEEAEKFWGKE